MLQVPHQIRPKFTHGLQKRKTDEIEKTINKCTCLCHRGIGLKQKKKKGKEDIKIKDSPIEDFPPEEERVSIKPIPQSNLPTSGKAMVILLYSCILFKRISHQAEWNSQDHSLLLPPFFLFFFSFSIFAVGLCVISSLQVPVVQRLKSALH